MIEKVNLWKFSFQFYRLPQTTRYENGELRLLWSNFRFNFHWFSDSFNRKSVIYIELMYTWDQWTGYEFQRNENWKLLSSFKLSIAEVAIWWKISWNKLSKMWQDGPRGLISIGGVSEDKNATEPVGRHHFSRPWIDNEPLSMIYAKIWITLQSKSVTVIYWTITALLLIQLNPILLNCV